MRVKIVWPSFQQNKFLLDNLSPLTYIVLNIIINVIIRQARGGGTLAKLLKDGVSYIQKDVLDVLIEFSSFKDRVGKKFKELSRELEGKSNEHNLWVNL